jgi:hypothetical protein
MLKIVNTQLRKQHRAATHTADVEKLAVKPSEQNDELPLSPTAKAPALRSHRIGIAVSLGGAATSAIMQAPLANAMSKAAARKSVRKALPGYRSSKSVIMAVCIQRPPEVMAHRNVVSSALCHPLFISFGSSLQSAA